MEVIGGDGDGGENHQGDWWWWPDGGDGGLVLVLVVEAPRPGVCGEGLRSASAWGRILQQHRYAAATMNTVQVFIAANTENQLLAPVRQSDDNTTLQR